MPLPNIVCPEAYHFGPVRLCVHPCVCPETLTWYLVAYLTHFHQTYISIALWERDECFTIWGQKVKGLCHGGITCWNRHCTSTVLNVVCRVGHSGYFQIFIHWLHIILVVLFSGQNIICCVYILCLCIWYSVVEFVAAVYRRWITIVHGSTTALVKIIKNISYFSLWVGYVFCYCHTEQLRYVALIPLIPNGW